jgi:hypothetical protein
MIEAQRLLKLLQRQSGLHVTSGLEAAISELEILIARRGFEEMRLCILKYLDEYESLLIKRRGYAEDDIIWKLLVDGFVNRAHARLVNEEGMKIQTGEQKYWARN